MAVVKDCRAIALRAVVAHGHKRGLEEHRIPVSLVQIQDVECLSV